MPDGPLSLARNGVRVAIRLTPRAKANRIIAVTGGVGRSRTLKATVTAPPEKGRANEALLSLLASAWHLPRHDLAIIAGAANRQKIVQISGDPQRLFGRLGSLISALPSMGGGKEAV